MVYPLFPKRDDSPDTPISTDERKRRLIEFFCLSWNINMRREHAVNVHVKKEGRKVIFTVPQNRWKYFFRDRGIIVRTPKGRKKPIYHAVIAHTRDLKTKTIPVRTHYRGARHFYWNGYECIISLPGKHGLPVASPDWAGYAAGSPELHNIRTVPASASRLGLNKLFEGETEGPV